ncbi:MAG: P1 family peptidase [candidate division KSB1 bacterium]|nr:P1 family peptidase [candidate division KSB1 bacterium]
MKTKFISLFLVISIFTSDIILAQQERARELGVIIGSFDTGVNNAITDVPGVLVGHITLIEGDEVRTGVTAIVPHSGNIFQDKVPAAIYIANGFGKLTAISQVEELGNIETPIILTNTLSVPGAADALIDYTLGFKENRSVRSVNPIVGETNDGRLNDIRGRHIRKSHFLEAIKTAATGSVAEGNVGAGTGTICFGYKGGIGTASRVLSQEDGGYTIGVLVQTNYGGELTIAGIPVFRALEEKKVPDSGDGSVMIIVATDAPLRARNLKRLARRATFGIARTGGNCSNGSGEYVVAFSVAPELRMSYRRGESFFESGAELRNDRMSPLFTAVIEATEEAVLNSLFAAQTMRGRDGLMIPALPVKAVLEMLRSYSVVR